MRPNQPTPFPSTAQPVVGPVATSDDELDVIRVGTVLRTRLSPLSSYNSTP